MCADGTRVSGCGRGGDRCAQCHLSEWNSCRGLVDASAAKQQVPAGDVGVCKGQGLALLGWEEKGREWLRGPFYRT